MKVIFGFAFAIVGIVACSSSNETVDPNTTTNTTTLPTAFKAFNSGLNAYVDGDYVVIKSTATPDHKSPYFGSSNANYEAYNGTNSKFSINPNRISTQNYTFRIPITPAKASSP